MKNPKWPAWNIRVVVTLPDHRQVPHAWGCVQAATEDAAMKQGLAWTRQLLRADKVPGRSKWAAVTVTVTRWAGDSNPGGKV